MTKRDLIRRLKEAGVVRKERVVLRSGQVSEFYCDLKKAYGYPDILTACADLMGERLDPSITCVAALGHGGLPLGAVIASRFDRHFIAVRSAPKDHGKGGMLDGYAPHEGDAIVIVDDVLTTGSSIKETIVALQATPARIDSAIVLVKRAEPALPIPYAYLLTVEELLN